MAHPFRASQAIFLQLPEAAEDHRYASRIIYVAEDEEIAIAAPTEDGRELSLEPGTPVILEVLLPDGIRRFPSVMRNGTPGNLLIEWPRDIERIQRRNHVRVEVVLPVRLEPIGRFENLPRRIEATTLDLSAGGMRVTTPDLMPSDVPVKVWLTLPDDVPLFAQGVVLRGQEYESVGGKLKYWAAVQFTAIDERDRREITRVVFEIQRELLRRGTA